MSSIDSRKLERARTCLVDALGEGAVLTAHADVQQFHDPYEGSTPTAYRPSFVAQPESVEGVQAVLSIARELGVPVWTSSTGRNYGYSGSAPIVEGSIVLNLRRMNRVLEINEADGYALCEPGVRFFDLYNAIKAQGAKLMMSVPDIGWGSVVGNPLDHGYGYTEMGDHPESVCGMEVVLASGEIVRTGLGAVSNSPMWQRRKRGFGPQLDSLFMQSNFGVVTKMGRWLAPQPEVIATGSLICDDDEGIIELVDAIHPLMLDGTIQGRPLITSSPEPEDGRAGPYDDTAGGSKQRKISATFPPGRWYARIAFYGREAMVDTREAILRKALAHLPKIKIDLRRYAGDVEAKDVSPLDIVAVGIPNMFLLEQIERHFGGTVGHLSYSPSIPFTGKDAFEVERMVQKTLREHGLVTGFGFIGDARCLQAACMILFDTANPDEIKAADKAVRSLIAQGAARGLTEYRAHHSLISDVVKHFDFGDHSLFKLYGHIKDALDPAGILSPGNHGIWGSS